MGGEDSGGGSGGGGSSTPSFNWKILSTIMLSALSIYATVQVE
jgi:hypothetical protein